MPESLQTVFVVDDEEPVADAIALLLRSVALKTRYFPDPRTFLAEYKPEMSGCLLLDVRMPKMGGLELQEEMNRLHYTLPIIFITGHGDVPMAVEAMRAGAIDFVQKPFNDDDLIRRVRKALAQDRKDREEVRQRSDVERRWNSLTPREQDVARLIASGDANKVVASKLKISERTVEVHRAHVFEKMDTRNLAQLVQVITLMS